LSHTEEKLVIGLNKAELTTRFSQRGDGGQILKVVKEEGRHAEDYEPHYGEDLEKCRGDDGLLEYLLKEPVYEDVIAVRDREVSRTLVETETDISFQIPDVFADIEERENVCATAVIEPEYKLLLGGKCEVLKQQMNCEDGDVFKDIKDVWATKESS